VERSEKTFCTKSTATLESGEHALADLRLAAHALPRLDRRLEDRVEARAHRPRLRGRVVGALHLGEDLVLAEHERVEARRHAEQVRDGLRALVAVEDGLDLREGLPRRLGEELREALVGRVRVELDAVARREEHGLPCARDGDGPLLRLDLGARRDRELLPHLERRGAVRQADNPEIHSRRF
jgi:hypothetical protein